MCPQHQGLEHWRQEWAQEKKLTQVKRQLGVPQVAPHEVSQVPHCRGEREHTDSSSSTPAPGCPGHWATAPTLLGLSPRGRNSALFLPQHPRCSTWLGPRAGHTWDPRPAAGGRSRCQPVPPSPPPPQSQCFPGGGPCDLGLLPPSCLGYRSQAPECHSTTALLPGYGAFL